MDNNEFRKLAEAALDETDYNWAQLPVIEDNTSFSIVVCNYIEAAQPKQTLALLDEIERLREALRPLAEWDNSYDGYPKVATWRMIKNAKAALTESQEDE